MPTVMEQAQAILGYRARVEDVGKLREQLEQGPTLRVGEADVVVAVFDVPDTTAAYGNNGVRQVIDRGAFEQFILRAGESGSRPFMLDHGDIVQRGGQADSRKVIGTTRNFKEASDGFQLRAFYNLRKTTARDAFEDLVFDQENGAGETVRFSFRNPADETLYRGSDGFEHVRSFTDVKEISQLPFGAQAGARAIPGSLVARQEEEQQTAELVAPTDEQLRSFFADGAFAEMAMNAILDVAPDTFRHAYHGERRPPAPPIGLIREWLQDKDWRKRVEDELRGDPAARDLIKELVGRAAEPDPFTSWWAHRLKIDPTTIVQRAAGTWNADAAMGKCSSASDYRSICAGEHSAGTPDERQHWALPHHDTPGGPPNPAGVRAALQRFSSTQNLVDKGAAKSHLDAHASSLGIGQGSSDGDADDTAK